MSTTPTTNETFHGLAFPVAKVRYTGSGYSATIRWGMDDTFRARVSYDHAIGPGATNASRAALAAHAKLTEAFPTLEAEEHVCVPGGLDPDTYVFTFVPRRFFDRA